MPQIIEDFAWRCRRLLSNSCWVGPGDAPAITRHTASYRYMRDWPIFGDRIENKAQFYIKFSNKKKSKNKTHCQIINNGAQRIQIALEFLQHNTRNRPKAVKLNIGMLSLPVRLARLQQPIAGQQLNKLSTIKKLYLLKSLFHYM